MNEELKQEIIDALEQYNSALEVQWWNTDSTLGCQDIRKRQAENEILLEKVRDYNTIVSTH